MVNFTGLMSISGRKIAGVPSKDICYINTKNITKIAGNDKSTTIDYVDGSSDTFTRSAHKVAKEFATIENTTIGETLSEYSSPFSL